MFVTAPGACIASSISCLFQGCSVTQAISKDAAACMGGSQKTREFSLTTHVLAACFLTCGFFLLNALVFSFLPLRKSQRKRGKWEMAVSEL